VILVVSDVQVDMEVVFKLFKHMHVLAGFNFSKISLTAAFLWAVRHIMPTWTRIAWRRFISLRVPVMIAER